MPYGRRSYRRHRRNYRRRGKYRRSRFRRPKVSRKRSRKTFAKTPRSVKRAGRLACPVVYECIKKIADSNVTWNLKSCEGVVTTTVDDFASTGADFSKAQGPYSATSETTMPPCGQMGMPIFSDVAVAQVQACVQHPADIRYRFTPFNYHVFPMLAMTNPSAGAAFNADNCRTTNQCTIASFDNSHSLRITWPADQGTSTLELEGIWGNTLTLHEVVWWIPNLTTVIDQGLVATTAETDTVAEAQAVLRTSRSWLKRMYNAYFCTHPVLDDGEAASPTAMLDVVDITTGAPTIGFDCWNEPLYVTAANRALQISDENVRPRHRDTKEYMAPGVLNRRKDARPKWQRKRTFRRPRNTWRRNGIAVDESGPGGWGLSARTQYIRAGKRFPINKKMEWEKLIADGSPGDEVREVVPRGCFCYVQYWYYRTGVPDATFITTAIAPSIDLDFTDHVDKTMVLKWQNL